IQGSVSDDEAVAAGSEVLAVDAGQPAHHHCSAEGIILSAPPGSRLHQAKRQGTIDLGEGPRLVGAIVPADLVKSPQATAKVLIGARGKPDLGASERA